MNWYAISKVVRFRGVDLRLYLCTMPDPVSPITKCKMFWTPKINWANSYGAAVAEALAQLMSVTLAKQIAPWPVSTRNAIKAHRKQLKRLRILTCFNSESRRRKSLT